MPHLADRANADPPTLTDRELDAVSARGFSFRSLNFAKTPPVATATPVATTTGLNDTDVKNVVFGAANTVNVNTAVNTCVFAICKDSGANIESNPTNENQISVTNSVAPSVNNMVSMPTVTNSYIGAGPTGNVPGVSTAALSAPTSQGVVKTRPPLPQVSWGIK